MFKSKGKLMFWGILVLIIVMLAAIFIPMTKMHNTMDNTILQLNKKYNDTFTMTWTSIEDTPMSDTFFAIVKSDVTGTTYDATIIDGDAIIDYELENYNAKINNTVEEAIDNSFALAKTTEGQLTLRVIVTTEVDEKLMQHLAQQLKDEFDLTTVAIDVIQIDQTNYDGSTEHIDQYYQRSTLEDNVFDEYDPIVTSYLIK